MTKVKLEQPQDTKTEQANQYYCFRCGAVIPEKIKRVKNKDGLIKGRCPSCKRIAVFYLPKKTEALSERMEKAIEKEIQKDKECKSPATKETFEKATNEEKKSIEDFQDPELLLNIKKELDKDHIGDDKAKLFLFADACSTQLIPEYRFSTAITGEKSEGKDNLWKTIFRHLPKEDGWFFDCTRITTSAIEGNLSKYNGLYFGEGNFEGGANAPIKDTIKALVEDGISVLKKDKKSDCRDAIHEVKPRMVGIYSTTSNPTDLELASRYCVISVHGNPAKYQRVNENTKIVAGNIDLQIDRQERKDKPTWILNGLRLLKKFDFVDIPYAPLLTVDSRDSRSQRDLKRFLNLIRSLAWICQRRRIQYRYRGYNVLVANAEDFYNAMEIGTEIFNQSFNEMEPRIQEVLSKVKEIINRPEYFNPTLEDVEEGLCWVDRSIVQRELDIKSRDTMIKRVNELESKNILTSYFRGNRTFIAFKFIDPASNLPSLYPLITVDKNELYALVDENESQIMNELLDGVDGKSEVNQRLLSPVEKSKRKILSLRSQPTVDSVEICPLTRKLSIIDVLKQKIDGKTSTVDLVTSQIILPQQRENKEKKSQIDRITEVKEYIEKIIASGHDGISYIALADHFPESFLSHLIESGQLFKIPGKNLYRWGEKK